MWRRALLAVVVVALAGPAAVAAGGCGDDDVPGERARTLPAPPAALGLPAAASRRASRALGRPTHGRLRDGVQLPESGPGWVTWDPIRRRVPNRPGRRWATGTLLEVLLGVVYAYRLANPGAPPVLIGDLSRRNGGVFDDRYGGLGHASHQNGLDADVYYPRRDRVPRAARRPGQVDRALAQDLVDRLVAAGARFAFVGLRVRLTGPPEVVQAIAHHDDHVHVRIAKPRP